MKDSRWLESFKQLPGIYLLPWLVLAPISITGTGTFIPEPNSGFSSEWFLVGLLAHLATGLVLLIGRELIKAVDENARVAVVLAILVVAGVARGVMVSASADYLGLIFETEYLWRIIAGIFLVVLFMGAGNVLLYEITKYKTQQRELNAQLLQEQQLLSKTREVLFNERKETLDETLKLMQLGMTQVESAKKGPEEVSQISMALNQMVDDGLGPLILKLKQDAESDLELPNQPGGRISGLELAKEAFLNRPYITPLAIALGTVGTFSSKFWVYGFFMAMLDLSLIALVMAISYFLGSKINTRLKSSPAKLISNLFFLMAPAVFAANLPLILFPGQPLPLLTSLSLFNNTFASGVVSAIGIAAVKLADESISQLAQTLKRVALARSRYQQLRLTERRKLSRLLHGSVQSRLRSLAMEVERTGVAPTKEKLLQLQSKIESEIFQRESANMDALLADLKELWENTASISYDIDSFTKSILAEDNSAQLAVTEVIREITSNAMKHSNSAFVDFKITVPKTWPEGGLVNLRLTANFDGQVVNIERHGNGLQVIEELTSDYFYQLAGSINEFWCEIPVQLSKTASTGT